MGCIVRLVRLQVVLNVGENQRDFASGHSDPSDPPQEGRFRVQHVQQRLEERVHVLAVDDEAVVRAHCQRQQKSEGFQEFLTTHIISEFDVLKTSNSVGEDGALGVLVHVGGVQTVLNDATKLGDIWNEGVDLGLAVLLEEEAYGAIQVERGQLRQLGHSDRNRGGEGGRFGVLFVEKDGVEEQLALIMR